MEPGVVIDFEDEEGDTDLVVLMKKALKNNPELYSLSLCTKNGVLIKTNVNEKFARMQTMYLSHLCDKARAVAREFEFKDELKFFTLRSTTTDFLVYVDRAFYLIGGLKPTLNDDGEPVINTSSIKKKMRRRKKT
ncbi:hypothetical protein O3M35_011340 [Rhynocoris fuscipes]|uniref:Roadblock/LAMTOR2 domain-containing protein n=1 Tax=Rhynocoris fuscipes TaxID=488301 RepID=A0AAW1CYH7_9HEMI